ncbi:hypothetical protein Cni_G26147 [Canna indica]|uniref:Uncharacterized protein n=1 Tax=Canna indica TaxID=4628 RepID=A0AAQ3QR14_9LILI|nr:hypothetical protein Cni_G26147 [Canna indica]
MSSHRAPEHASTPTLAIPLGRRLQHTPTHATTPILKCLRLARRRELGKRNRGSPGN